MSKISNQMGAEDEDEDEAIDADPDFYRGTGVFVFPNGDSYKGDYIAHCSGIVWREGKGIYTTKDEQIYSGTWYNDELKDTVEAEITYADGTKYDGHIVECQYAGPAKYTIRNDFHILCNFVDNKPEGDICMVDIKGREWRAEAGENGAVFLPEHTFFNDIPTNLGKGTLRVQRAKTSEEQISQSPKTTMDSEALSKLEQKIFAKTKKTVSDLKFEDSNWYQRWKRFREVYDNINSNVKEMGEDGLREEERDWLAKYSEFKKRYIAIMETRLEPKYKNLKDCKLFELYNAEDCMPIIPVFTSTYVEAEKRKRDGSEKVEVVSSLLSYNFL